MKKRIKYLIFILLFIPVFVLADGGEPVFFGYFNGYVSDSNGASLYTYDEDKEAYYKTDILLPYNTSLTVEDQVEVVDGITYGLVKSNSLESILGKEVSNNEDEDDEEDDGYDTETEYYINIDKVTPIKEKFTIIDWIKDHNQSDLSHIETNYEILTVKDEFKIYNGPSIKYSLVKSNFGKNSKFYVKYRLEGWIYVEGNGVSGWSNEEDYAGENNAKIWILDGSEVYSSIDEDKLDIVIPNDTILNLYYDVTIDDDEYYIVKYNDKFCYLDKSKVAIYYDSVKNIAIDNIDLYDKIKGQKNKKDK